MKKLFTLLTLLVTMGTSAWGDNVSIPQDMGSYIVIGTSTGADGFASYVTKNNCQVDSRLGDAGNNQYYTVGSTRGDSKVNINVTASEAGNYVFGFKSGASGCASIVTVTLTKSGSETPLYSSGDVTIENDGNWDPNIEHNFYIEGVEAADYTLSLEVKEITSGSYAGNFGNFFFHKTDQLAWPTSPAYMELSDGTFKDARDNIDNVINYISRTGGYIDDLLIYNSTAGYRIFHFNIDSHKQASKVTITVTDFATGRQEAQVTKVVTANGDYLQPLTTEISAGLKKVRFDFADNDETADNDYLFNFRQVYFTSPDVLPMYGTAVLDLSQGSMTDSSNPRYGSSSGTNNEISYIYNGGYADNFYVVIDGEETAYYDLRTTTSNYNKGGTFKVTITDIKTGTVEVDAVESSEIISNNQNIVMPLIGTLSPGLKKIRLDFVKAGESSWLYNIKDICFYKRSLNENYDYTPVAATGIDVVLTRNLTAGNWSTIVLPFAMTSAQLKAAFGNDVKVAALTSATESTLTFTSLDLTSGETTTTANQPYAIKVLSNFISATISNVTIETGTPTQTVDGWTFNGSYAAETTMPANAYYFKSNQLYSTGANTYTHKIKGFRGYFTYSATPAPELNFVIDGETTGIENVNRETITNNSYFNLNGQRVAQPTKGLYIVNGKKVIVK